MNDLSKILARVDALFMRYGIKSVTMDDIARELGMSKKTLYQFVDNKADLLDKALDMHLRQEQELIKEIQKNSKNAIDEMMEIAMHVHKHLRRMNPSAMYDIQKYYKDCWNKVQEHKMKYIYTVMKENLERGIEEKLYRENINPDVIARFYIAKTELIQDELIFPSREYDLAKIHDDYMVYHMHGVASKKGLKMLNKFNELNKD